MKVSLKKAFSILDGRLSTNMEDIFLMLNYIFDEKLYTHQVPSALRDLIQQNPLWFSNAILTLNKIKEAHGDDFESLMVEIDKNHSDVVVELGKLTPTFNILSGIEKINTVNK